VQEIAAFLIIAGAAGWLAWRSLRRRGSENCCGETECPAAKQTLRRLERNRR